MLNRQRWEPEGAPRRVVFTDRGRRDLARGTLAGGAVSGVTAGIAMGVLAVVQSLIVGLGALLPSQSAAALFYGVDAFIGGAGSALVGLVIHLVFSAVLGIIFASMVRPGTNAGTAFAGGLLYGGVVWALMTFVVLPIFNPVMSARVALISGWWFFEHMVYGGCLAVTPALVRRYTARGPRPGSREAGTMEKAA